MRKAGVYLSQQSPPLICLSTQICQILEWRECCSSSTNLRDLQHSSGVALTPSLLHEKCWENPRVTSVLETFLLLCQFKYPNLRRPWGRRPSYLMIRWTVLGGRLMGASPLVVLTIAMPRTFFLRNSIGWLQKRFGKRGTTISIIGSSLLHMEICTVWLRKSWRSMKAWTLVQFVRHWRQ